MSFFFFCIDKNFPLIYLVQNNYVLIHYLSFHQLNPYILFQHIILKIIFIIQEKLIHHDFMYKVNTILKYYEFLKDLIIFLYLILLYQIVIMIKVLSFLIVQSFSMYEELNKIFQIFMYQKIYGQKNLFEQFQIKILIFFKIF